MGTRMRPLMLSSGQWGGGGGGGIMLDMLKSCCYRVTFVITQVTL